MQLHEFLCLSDMGELCMHVTDYCFVFFKAKCKATWIYIAP